MKAYPCPPLRTLQALLLLLIALGTSVPLYAQTRDVPDSEQPPDVYRDVSRSGVTAATRSSPFEPPEPSGTTFVVDDGPFLDTGCTFRSGGPLLITLQINQFVGDVDGNGRLLDVNGLIQAGILSGNAADLSLPAFDVDFDAVVPGIQPERDRVSFNGNDLGFLTGTNNVWKLNSFRVPLSQVAFPQRPAPGAPTTPAANEIRIDIDTANANESWCTAIDWAALVVPLELKSAFELDVVAGNEVREIPDGIIWKQSFENDCTLKDERVDFDMYPFSGPATAGLFGLFSGEAKLKVTITPCPVSDIDPEVKAEWEIAGTTLKGVASWTGFEGELTLNMPEEIGTYDVDFTFTVDGDASTFQRKLFVTYSEPLAQVSAPKRVWYEKATDWASGEDAVDGALMELLDGIYAYGGGNWRYGYNFGAVGKCDWEQLVADPITCDYSDCYVFSDVLENMAATLGIGGLGAIRVTGSAAPPGRDAPFITTGAPSLDPAFTGSARPLAGGAYDRYWFTSHSLRKRGFFSPDYYDATFNGIYGNQRAFIDWNVNGIAVDAIGLHYTTVEGAKVYELPGNSYDGWGNYAYVSPPAPSPIAAEAPSFLNASTSAMAADITFTGAATFSPLDENGDGAYEALVAEVDVEVSTAGVYTVLGLLKKGSDVVANMPAYFSMLPSRATLDVGPGTHTVELRFSGEQIRRSGEDGPYDLELFGIGASGQTTTVRPTPAYDHTSFGELAAAFQSVSDASIDDDGDGEAELLRLTVTVEVVTPGTYKLQGALSKEDDFFASAGASFTLPAGTHALTLDFPGQAIRRSGYDGPYDGLLNLLDETNRTLESLEFQTQPYTAPSFGAFLELDGSFDDEGVDGDGNGLFELLRIRFGADVARPGTYLLSGKLSSDDSPLAVFSDAEVTLPAGPQTLTLDFLGALIQQQAIDGPYTVEVVLRDPAFTTLDRVVLPQQTQAYVHTDFEGFVAAGIVLTGNATDQGIDDDGNGLYDRLLVDVEVELLAAGAYQWSGSLLDENGTEIDFYASSAFLGPGIATIRFAFDGRQIGANATDGPYVVRNLLMFSNAYSLVAADVASTGPYAYTEFEDAPPGCPSTLTITAFDADQGDPDTAEYVEITNTGTQRAALAGCALVFYDGLTERSYYAADLSGAVDAGAAFRIGNPAAPGVQQTFPDDTLRDGPAAIALYRAPASSFPNGTAVTVQDLLSAVVYASDDDIYGTSKSGAGAAETLLRLGTLPQRTAASGPPPDAFRLEQNYPNPFNPTTAIRYTVPEASAVRLAVYDPLGRRVRVLVDGPQEPGAYEVRWDGRDRAGQPVASGVYLYELVADGYRSSRTMLLMK